MYPIALQVSVMLRLLDNCLMPEDLPPIREDGSDDWVYALPGRKHDKQLFRLAAANAEAEGAYTTHAHNTAHMWPNTVYIAGLYRGCS